MIKRLVYWGIAGIIYINLFRFMKFIFDKFVPWNRYTDIISIFIAIIVLIPLTVIFTEKLIKFIKENY